MQAEIAKMHKSIEFLRVFERLACHEAGGHVAGCAENVEFSLAFSGLQSKIVDFLRVKLT